MMQSFVIGSIECIMSQRYIVLGLIAYVYYDVGMFKFKNNDARQLH